MSIRRETNVQALILHNCPGDVFYSLELVLQFNPGQYKRVVRVNSAESDNSTVRAKTFPQSRMSPYTLSPQIISLQGVSSQRWDVLQEGCIVTFGANSKIRYRYLPPQVCNSRIERC